MQPRDLIKLGIPPGAPLDLACAALAQASRAGMRAGQARSTIAAVAHDPERYVADTIFGPVARAIGTARRESATRDEPAPWTMWGEDLDPQSIRQLENACTLPIAVRGALMPDAHPGYGLPIGGVLATRNAVIPYAVGVDIACRVKMSVLDLPADRLDKEPARLTKAIETETRFGLGASFRKTSDRRQHAVMDEDWSVSPVTGRGRDKAWAQLGTSGTGNHFVEFGTLDVEASDDLGLTPGSYLALLSHSGSRGTGAAVAAHYSRIAREQRPGLPDTLRHLAWLDLDTAAGAEYWAAMELMGRYAAANHACIHRHVAKHLGAKVLLDLENHHNFAWKEIHDDEAVVVHRKGATPAGAGVLGIIPGSMATATYIARGRGCDASLHSAAHGAGRIMSRTQARKTLSWTEARRGLKAARVTLLSAGLDEVPMVYKDIDAVMAAQSDLVEPIATFRPRLVKMAPAGERAED